MKRGRDQLEADGSEEGRGEQAAPAAAGGGGSSGDAEQEQQQQQEQQQPGTGQQPPAQQAEDDDEDDKPLLQNYKMSKSLRKGIECPYLDTISRQVGRAGGLGQLNAVFATIAVFIWWSCGTACHLRMPQPPSLSLHKPLHRALLLPTAQNLDFDFEKCCSVSLSGHNVYACLVCGKYFQVQAPAAIAAAIFSTIGDEAPAAAAGACAAAGALAPAAHASR